LKEIKLTKGQVATVDDEDFERLSQFKWHALKRRASFCAVREDWNGGRKKRKTILMHREILAAPSDLVVDHINGNPLDNCRINLRLATKQQNSCNRNRSQKNNKLGVKGVSWHKRCGKYKSAIQYNRKSMHLGLFASLDDADKAYRDAEIKYFGEFARTSVVI